VALLFVSEVVPEEPLMLPSTVAICAEPPDTVHLALPGGVEGLRGRKLLVASASRLKNC
jgi:hypothetical protein